MNSTKSSVRKRITTLQAELGGHSETFLDRSRTPVVRPRPIVVAESTLGNDWNDLPHPDSLRATADASTPIATGERLTGNRTADGFEQARDPNTPATTS